MLVSDFVGQIQGTKPTTKDDVAFLLPAALAYLQQLSKPAVPAVHAAPAQQLEQQLAPSAAGSASLSTALSAARQATAASYDTAIGTGPPDDVKKFFAAEITKYMTARPKAPQGVALQLYTHVLHM